MYPAVGIWGHFNIVEMLRYRGIVIMKYIISSCQKIEDRIEIFFPRNAYIFR